MMKRTTFVSIAAVIFVFASIEGAVARIGWTAEKCIEKYGEPVGAAAATLSASDGDATVFEKNKVKITIEFRKGKAWYLLYRKPGLTDLERHDLLSNNAEGHNTQWRGPGKYFGREYWITDDGSMHAIIRREREGAAVVVMSDDCATSSEEERQKRLKLAGTDEGNKLIEEQIKADSLEGL